MHPKALIFDVDGTLAQTEEAHRHAFNDTFAEFGLTWHWGRELYRELLKTTGGKERMRDYAANHLLIDPADIPVVEIHTRKTERYGALIDGGAVSLRPGVLELIVDAADKGVRLAIATTTNLVNVDRLIRAAMGHPAEEMFEVIAAGDMVENKKPAPDVYNLALKGLGLPGQACLSLEDSLNGLRASIAAGVACVICPSTYTAHEDFAGAALQVDDFRKIARVKMLPALLPIT